LGLELWFLRVIVWLGVARDRVRVSYGKGYGMLAIRRLEFRGIRNRFGIIVSARVFMG
jgi:hypothetical protein